MIFPHFLESLEFLLRYCFKTKVEKHIISLSAWRRKDLPNLSTEAQQILRTSEWQTMSPKALIKTPIIHQSPGIPENALRKFKS